MDGKTLIPDSTHYNSYIFNRLQNLNSDIEAQTGLLLARLLEIDTVLRQSIYRMSTREVGDVKINSEERVLLRKEKMTLCRELSDLLDIVIVKQAMGGVSVVS